MGEVGAGEDNERVLGEGMSLLLSTFYFHFSDNFLPISYQYIQETDEEDKRGGGGDG